MLTLVNIRPPDMSSVDAATLLADYLAFDRQRTLRRQYMTAFGGIAIIVLIGGLFHQVPRREALIVSGLLAVVPVWQGLIEAVRWRSLAIRLNRARAEVHDVKKVVKNS